MHLGKVRKLNLVITWWFFFNTFWSFRTVFLYYVTQYVSKLKEIINYTEHLKTELGLFCTHKKGVRYTVYHKLRSYFTNPKFNVFYINFSGHIIRGISTVSFKGAVTT